MSIEEKAKAYDEALERAKKVLLDKETTNHNVAEFIFPELHEEEKPLTPFQQCLNCILRGVYYAEVPDKKVNEFILNVVRTRTDELIKLAKRHEDTDCQLRENEDERIRKALIDALKVSETIGELKFRLPYPTREECIAYLEKQKEPTKEELYAEVGTTEKEYIANTMKMVRAMREKKQEQKPISQEDFDTAKHEALWDEQKPAWGEVELLFRGEKVTVKRPFYRDDKGRGYSTTEQDEEVAWNALRAWCEKKGISLYDLYPKAEWSEEDDQLIGFIFDLLNDLIWRKDWAMSKEECLERLKSLRPQPKQEWSEKDNEMFHCICASLCHLRKLYETNEDKVSDYNAMIEWFRNRFKSLRPSWKPSEEQMEALEKAIVRSCSHQYGVPLSELYEQLKKL